MPAAQSEQLAAPVLPLYAPGGQLSAAVARSRQYDPAGQLMHCVAPVVFMNVPASHELQVLALAALYVPMPHASALVAPAAHAEPAGQSEQSPSALAPLELR